MYKFPYNLQIIYNWPAFGFISLIQYNASNDTHLLQANLPVGQRHRRLTIFQLGLPVICLVLQYTLF